MDHEIGGRRSKKGIGDPKDLSALRETPPPTIVTSAARLMASTSTASSSEFEKDGAAAPPAPAATNLPPNKERRRTAEDWAKAPLWELVQGVEHCLTPTTTTTIPAPPHDDGVGRLRADHFRLMCDDAENTMPCFVDCLKRELIAEAKLGGGSKRRAGGGGMVTKTKKTKHGGGGGGCEKATAVEALARMDRALNKLSTGAAAEAMAEESASGVAPPGTTGFVGRLCPKCVKDTVMNAATRQFRAGDEDSTPIWLCPHCAYFERRRRDRK
jgi:DNA-directed RNA polymerase subunit M/transcription elongation factor TFIIS